jgi:hypothetical protein
MMLEDVRETLDTAGIGEVIGERTLKRSVGGVQAPDLIVRIGRPQELGDGSYICPFEVRGLHRRIRFTAGFDAIDALQAALRMISIDVHYARNEPSAELYWLEPGDDLGYPDLDGMFSPDSDPKATP